jgi:ABC-type phosphate transport system substrate-binding protein
MAHAGGPGSPFAIIANKDVETEALSRSAARAIFGMRLHAWDDGEAVRVYVLPDDNVEQTAFAKACLSIFPHQLRRVWDRLVFSGIGQAPNVVQDSQNMLNAVATNAGAIGFLPRDMLNDTVRVLELR